MSYNITARETGNISPVVGSLEGIKSDKCAEQILRALIHAGYEVTIKEKHEPEKVACNDGACEPQRSSTPPIAGRPTEEF
ncbi:MAG: hypothetical protein ACYDG4_10790 [Desulfuromonadaceae bacterium]